MTKSKKTALKFLLTLLILTGGFLFVQNVFAQDFGTDVVGKNIALSAGDPRIIAAKIVRVALGFLGIIAVCVVLYGGFLWMTSAGNEETIGKAKKVLINGLIGLIIILTAFTITQFVLNSLLGRVGAGGGGAGGPPLIGRYSGALGNGIIESHYPPRGGTGIPRNTKIIVTFKEKMLLESIIEGYDDKGTALDINDDTVMVRGVEVKVVPPVTEPVTPPPILPLKSENVRIFKSRDGETGAGGVKNYLSSDQVNVTFTPDLKNFVFDPIGYLGSPTENMWYTVALKPGIKKADDMYAFTGAFSEGYAWDFEVSTIIDTTPPQVRTVVPIMAEDMDRFRVCVAGGESRERCDTLARLERFMACVDGGGSRERCGAWARNVIVQINFSEAMDPTTVSGINFGDLAFNKILTTNAGGVNIQGTWEIGNQYRTIEFVTNDKCGTNSCGGDVFCLPEDETVSVVAIAASLGRTPPEAVSPYDGIVDVCGNSLDGDKNGTAGGPPAGARGTAAADNYYWSFETSSTIDLTPPKIRKVNPSPEAPNISIIEPINMIFTKLMSITSFKTSNILLQDDQRDQCAVWFSLEGENLEGDDTVPEEGETAVRTQAIIRHGNLLPTGGVCSDDLPANGDWINYFPVSRSDVQDLFQNCFYEPLAEDEGVGVPVGGHTCTVVGEELIGKDGELPADCEPWE